MTDYGRQAANAMMNQAHCVPRTASAILESAVGHTKMRLEEIQRALDAVPGLKEEKLNLEALLARFQGREDE